jgi:signal transduction histidine kinase
VAERREVGRILLVEDNPDLAENLHEILEGAGHAVVPAATCSAARADAAAGFDVALVDVRLPDGDGIQLAAGLKSVAPDAEVILLTGFATLESAMSAVRAGAWAYLVKPCAPADLLIALGQALRQVRLQRDKHELARKAQLAEKLAALGAMAAGLAHEIRNPLNAAQLQLGLAERRVRACDAPELAGALDSLALVRAEMQRLNRLVEDVLTFAHPGVLNAAPGDLARTVDTVARFLAPEVASSGVTLHVDGTQQVVEARYDEARIKQVLINLVRNAVEAAGHGGEVWVTVNRRGPLVELCVEDSGPGVSAGLDPFVPFVTTKERGTGLGLPTAHRILAEHGGTLQLARERGRTAFVAQLPGGGA